MATVDVLSWENKKVGSVELNSAVFEIPVRKEILHSIVRWQLAGRRQGTHKAKTRGEVSGGGKKPFKQKGTGNARQGSTRSPLMPGGGITFGPVPRDYSYSLNRKFKQLGLKTALSLLVSEGKLKVVDQMSLKEGKTKDLVKQLKVVGLEKALLIDSQSEANFSRASRNLPKIQFRTVDGLNVYDLLKFETAVITKGSLAKIEERCGVQS
jgi:large subunit ribosomal protein L4